MSKSAKRQSEETRMMVMLVSCNSPLSRRLREFDVISSTSSHRDQVVFLPRIVGDGFRCSIPHSLMAWTLPVVSHPLKVLRTESEANLLRLHCSSFARYSSFNPLYDFLEYSVSASSPPSYLFPYSLPDPSTYIAAYNVYIAYTMSLHLTLQHLIITPRECASSLDRSCRRRLQELGRSGSMSARWRAKSCVPEDYKRRRCSKAYLGRKGEKGDV